MSDDDIVTTWEYGITYVCPTCGGTKEEPDVVLNRNLSIPLGAGRYSGKVCTDTFHDTEEK